MREPQMRKQIQKAFSGFSHLAIAVTLAIAAPCFAAEVPSVVSSEAIFWLDAAYPSSITLDASGRVTRWNSRVGSNYAKAPASGLTYPSFSAMAYGIPTVDFGTTGSNKDLLINSRITTIRTAFFAVKIEANSNAFWLGDSNNSLYDFHRGGSGAYANQTYGTKFDKIWNGLTQVSDIYTTVPDASKFNIVTLQMKQSTVAGSLTRDRVQAGRNGGRQLSELILFSRVLTDAERESVIEYLQDKWIEKDILDVRVTAARTDSVTEFSRDGGESWASSLDFTSQYNSDIVLQARNTQTAGCYFDWSGLPSNAVFLDPFHAAVSLKTPLPSPFAVTCRSIEPSGTSNNWIGGSGNFEDGENWSLGRMPRYIDDVVIGNAADGTVTNTITVSTAFEIKSLIVGDANAGSVCLVLKNGLSTNVVANSVTVNARGRITHYGPSDNLYHLNLKAGGNMTIESGGWVDGYAKGIAAGKAILDTGAIVSVGNGGTKGGHGGRGANRAYCYDNIRNPVLPGMGGVSRSGWAAAGGGNGGGVIYLEAGGNLVVDGEVSSDAGGEYDQSQPGGSLIMKCASLTGNGRITANPTRSTAGGGRIAIYQTTATSLAFSGLLSPSAGSEYVRNFRYYNPLPTATLPSTSYFDGSAGAGTIYVENANDTPGRGTLIVKGCNKNDKIQNYTTDISALVGDSQEPFGAVIVTNGAHLAVRDGCTLKVISLIDTRGGRLSTSANTCTVEFVGEGDATYFGSNTLYNVKCTVPGKTIRFGAPSSLSKLVIPAGGTLTLTGEANNPVTLLPSNPSEKWFLNINADANTDVSYVAVSNCNASTGKAVLAIDSADLGGNDYWSFSSAIVPGATNTWTGEASTDWADSANWSLSRAVEPTDVALVPANLSNYPVIPTGTYIFNEIVVESGAALSLTGDCSVTVTNNFSCAGSLSFANKETLTLLGNADLSGSTVVPALARVYVRGNGSQSVDLGGNSFHKLLVKRDGGSLALKGGFSAHAFRCLATNAVQSIVFDAGATYSADEIYLNGLVGSEKRLSLSSSTPGSTWFLNVDEFDQCLTGVVVSDCDARGGATVVAGASSDGLASNNYNFDFATVTANWCGGLTNKFSVAANWAPAGVPGAGAKVTVFSEEDGPMSITLDANNAVSIGSLSVCGTDNARVTLTANSSISTSGDFFVRTNATVLLNVFNDSGSAPNAVGGDAYLRNGGKITHTGPNTSKLYAVHLSVAGDMTIEEGASIDVTAKGYSAGNGPGFSGTAGSLYAAYAGFSRAGVPYGSILRPVDYGSGTTSHSGTSIAEAYRNGGHGGGSIRLEVAGDLDVDGEIKANGAPEYDHGTPGGSILIHTGTLSGSGKILAQAGIIDTYGQNGQGSGGRIAIYQTGLPSLSRFSGTISTTIEQNGGVGTVIVSGSDAAESGIDLLFHKETTSSVAKYATPFPMQADYVNEAGLKTTYANVNLKIGAGATVYLTNSVWTAGSTVRVRDLELQTSTSKLYLLGSRIEVVSRAHKNGRGWYDGSYAAATNSKRIVVGATPEGVPGEIVWLPGGLAITVR